MSILNGLGVQRYESVLKNGIRVILFYRAGAPIATSAIVNSGSQYDPENSPGMAHFIEHMITNGSPEFPAKDLLAEHIESVGGAFGARTNQEFQIVDTEVSEKADYGRVVDLFRATLCNPLMDEKVFHNEKKIVIKEIQKSFSNPNRLMYRTGRALFFKDSVLEHDVLGTEESITNLDFTETVNVHKKLFDASRITFVASGDIMIEELIAHLDILEFSTGNLFNRNTITLTGTQKDKTHATYFDTTQTHINFGVPAPFATSKEMIQFNLLGAIIAGGRSARLTKRLRYEKGLIYSVSYSNYGSTECSQWVITTDTSEDKIQEVIDEIINEIKDLQKNGVIENELQFVKDRKIKGTRRQMQTSQDWVDFHMKGEAFAVENAMNIENFIEIVNTTTVSDIQNIINTYLCPENWQLALVGRTKPEDIKYNW